MIEHKTLSTQQPGFILVTVVLTLTILATLALMLSRQSAINTDGVVREHQPDTSRYVAEAGYNHAVWQLNRLNCTGYTDISNTSFGNHSYTATITDTAGTPLTGGSPAKISATGSLVDGISHSLMRENVKIYQTPTTTILQPGAANGKDTYLYEWKKTWNYGASNTLWVRNNWANSYAYSLLKFDVSTIPSGVKILSAKLELWQNTPSANGGSVGVRRILTNWVEGTETGGIGTASWNDRDSGVAWTSPGGDFASTVDTITTIPAATVGWNQWNISNLVSGWVRDAASNQGFILTPESVNTYVEFNSSNNTTPGLHPKLTITYACECGLLCTGLLANDLLLVVVDPVSLTTQESDKKTLFESWGYTVTTIDVDDGQASFDTAVANNDVVFITEDINSGDLGTKLSNAAIGVVTEEDNLSDEFGISSTITWGASVDTLNINDNSHYITQPFSPGNLNIMTVPNSLANVTGTLAEGLTTLGSHNGGPALVTLEAGATTYWPGTAAGRRVLLPWGNNTFDVNALTSDGLTILQRSLEWGAATTLIATVATGNDDAEERVSNGNVDLTSSDLELVTDGSNNQYVGMRFAGLTVPPGASISNAYIQFKVDETNSGATNVTIRIEDTDNAATFTTSTNNISNRSLAAPSVAWSPAAWNTVGERGADQRTPDISTLLQAVVDRAGWASGNAMVIIISGTGERTAESYNGDTTGAAMLHIEYN